MANVRTSIRPFILTGLMAMGITAGAVTPAPLAVGWTSTGSLGHTRHGHTATLLSNGIVLVVGGRNLTPSLSNCEFFNPATGQWQSAPSLSLGVRSSHEAILLNSGKVLVAGGYNGSTAYSSCELFDPATFVWSATGSMASPRNGLKLAPLLDGRILAVGGSDGISTHLSSCEIYDPSAGTWSATGAMSVGRTAHSVNRLRDGRVFAAGGTINPSGALTASCDIFNPATGTWTAAAPIPSGNRFHHAGTTLPDGRVLISGGQAGAGSFVTCHIFDSVVGTWSNTGSLAGKRDSHLVVVLPTGKALAVGGAGNTPGTDTSVLSSCELFDPAAGTWSSAPSIPNGGGWEFPGVLLSDGRLLAPGAYQYGSATNACAIFDPEFVHLEWTVNVRPGGDDTRDIAIGESGIYLAGMTPSASLNASDAFVSKLGFDGSGVWHSTFGAGPDATSENDWALATTVDGTGAYVGGHTDGNLFGFGNTTDFPRDNGFVRKLDHSGNVLWTDQNFGHVRANVQGMISHTSGIYAVGNVEGALPGLQALGATDAFIRKYTPTGVEVWSRQFGSLDKRIEGIFEVSAHDAALDVWADSTGVYVAGQTGGALPGQVYAGGAVPQPGTMDGFVRKYDFDGSELWTRQIGTAFMESAVGISGDASGVYVVGTTRGALPGFSNPEGRPEAFIRKFGADGSVLWTRQFGQAEAYCVAVRGSSAYVGGQGLPGPNGFVRKFSSGGEVIWTKSVGPVHLFAGVTGLATTATAVYAVGPSSAAFTIQPYLIKIVEWETTLPPVANAGPDQTVECTGHPGTPITLNGSASSDPDGGTPSYAWTGSFGNATGVSPTISLPLGAHLLTLTVMDLSGLTSTDTVAITIRDTTPPVISNVPASVTVEQASLNGTPLTLPSPTVFDICDPTPTLTNNSLSIYPLGITIVTYTATDDSGRTATAATTVTVRDTTKPTITAPPNGSYPQGSVIQLGTPTVSDICDASPAVTNNAPGTFGLGQTVVTWTATDASGNSQTATQTVTVFSMSGLGSMVSVGPGSIFGQSITVGNGSQLGGVTVGDSVSIGANVMIGNGTTIQKSADIKAGVQIGPSVLIGEDATIEINAVIGEGTIVGKNVTIKPGAWIGKNVKIGYNTTIEFGAILEDGVVIGDNTTVKEGTTVKAGAKIGKNSQIEKNLAIGAGASIGDSQNVQSNVAAGASVGGTPTVPTLP